MRLIASSQPSGVVRMYEIRLMLPLASGAWHVPHLVKVSWSVTGNPASACFFAGVVTSTSGVEAVVFGATAERESQEKEAAKMMANEIERQALREQPGINVDPSQSDKNQARARACRSLARPIQLPAPKGDKDTSAPRAGDATSTTRSHASRRPQ